MCLDQMTFEQLIPKHPKSPSDRGHVPIKQLHYSAWRQT